MPLVATVGSERVESWKLSASEWLGLKATYRKVGLVMSCGQPGLPKTSQLGNQFFAHKNGTLCALREGGPETQQHLRAKAIIAETARGMGWAATVECPSADRSWIADVMIEKAGRRVAVEVQWSTQSNLDFRRRQTRYESDGVECFWLAGPTNSKNVSGVPSIPFSGTTEEVFVSLPMKFAGGLRPVTMAEGIQHILGESIRPRIEALVAGVEIRTAMRRCWSGDCKKWMSLWYADQVLIESRCGQHGTISLGNGYRPWQASRLEEQIQSAVIGAMRGADLAEPTSYAVRHSDLKRMDYAAQICPHCHFVQGDGHVGSTWEWDRYAVPMRLRLPISDAVLESPHVCLDVGNGLCSQERSATGAGFPLGESHLWMLQASGPILEAAELPVRKRHR